MSHNVIPPHSLLEGISNLVNKLKIKGTQESESENGVKARIDLDTELRIQVMTFAPQEILQSLLEKGADPKFSVKGASTYELAKAFDNKQAIKLLENHIEEHSASKKPHTKS